MPKIADPNRVARRKPPCTEYRTVDTTTLAGLRLAERLHVTGWKAIRVGLFTTQFQRRVVR